MVTDPERSRVWRRLEGGYEPLPVRASDIGHALTRHELRYLSAVAATEKDWEAAFWIAVVAALR